MIRPFLAALLVGSASLVGQTCNYNQYPIRLVDSLGNPMPIASGVAEFSLPEVYLAFDPSLPDGIHRFFVQITDTAITTVTATSPAADRVVDVIKTGTLVTLNFPFAVTQPELGLGIGGIGQSLKLRFVQPQNQPGVPCSHKAWVSTGWAADALTGLPVLAGSPFVTGTGTYPNCRIASFQIFAIENCGTNPTPVCDGRTIGYWRNPHGRNLVTSYGLLGEYAALNLVNADGSAASPFASLSAYASWLQRANATNMAYMLSAQLVGMYNNVRVGNASRYCRIHDPVLGNTTIGAVLDAAVLSLYLYPLTPSGHPERANQEALKHALDAANNNTNWGWL
jgi:hypothetical protein